MSYLKEQRVFVESIGETLTIKQLPAIAQIQIMESQESGAYDGLFVACKYGVVEWSEKTIDELKGILPMSLAVEVSGHVFALSGDDSKKSEGVPPGDSSSD